MDNKHLEKETPLYKFKLKKDCTINSIKEIEYFLCNLNKAIKCLKIYKFLK